MKEIQVLKVSKKTIIVFFIFLIFMYIMQPAIVLGANGGEDTLDDIIQSGNDFLNAADDSMNTIDEGDLQGLSKFISGVLLSIAIGVTVISGVVLGIKFVTQSIEDKAKIKEAMVPWIIGIMVSFGAFTIWEITINFFQNM